MWLFWYIVGAGLIVIGLKFFQEGLWGLFPKLPPKNVPRVNSRVEGFLWAWFGLIVVALGYACF